MASFYQIGDRAIVQRFSHKFVLVLIARVIDCFLSSMTCPIKMAYLYIKRAYFCLCFFSVSIAYIDDIDMINN